MDSVIRTNSGAPLITPWTPRGMSNGKFAALQAADAKKQTIESSAQKAFEAPTMKAAEKSKGAVRERIEGIRKRLTILRKLFSGNPKEMARALAQVFKELKAALKEYKAATDKELSSSDASLSQMMPSLPSEATDTPKDEASNDETSGDGETKDESKAKDSSVADPATPTEPAPVSADDRSALYGQIEGQVRKTIGEDALQFSKELKGLIHQIEEKMLNPARIQMKAKKPDKATDEAFKDVEDSLKDLRKDVEDMERDIRRDVPTAGMHIDIAA